VASGDRDSFQLASSHTMILYPSRGGESRASAPKRSANYMAWIQTKCRTSLLAEQSIGYVNSADGVEPAGSL
jgi:hypothetical protein